MLKVTRSWYDGPAVGTVTYDGAVLRTFGRDVRVMSDVWEWLTYAEVWDEATATVKEVSADGSHYDVTVDATPDVVYKAWAYFVAKALDKAKADWAARVDAAVAAAHRVEKGKRVKVVKGRKVKKGTEGVVIWKGPGRAYSYADMKWGVPDRIGLKDDAGTVHWTSASNVEVLDGWDHFDSETYLDKAPTGADFLSMATREVDARFADKYSGYPAAA